MPAIAYVALWNVAGNPAASVPCGLGRRRAAARGAAGRPHRRRGHAARAVRAARAGPALATTPWSIVAPTVAVVHHGSASRSRDLAMAYGELRAVDGVSFEVAEGEFFGILGPNGAGKTTTLEMIEGLRKPDAGTIRGAGRVALAAQRRPAAADRRAAPGVVVLRAADRARADPHLRRAVRRLRRPAATSGSSGSGWSTRPAPGSRTCPAGRRSGSRSPARWSTTPRWSSSTSRPPSLDPQARRNLWDLLSGLNDAGRTVVLTTHYMDEAEALCDRVAIMDHGRILELDTPPRWSAARRADPDHRAPTRDRRDRATARTGRRTRSHPAPPVLARLAEERAARRRPRAAPARSRTSSSTSPAGSTAHEHPARALHARSLALSLAILRGFLARQASVFFAIVFPLMFLVLFGGLFADQTQSKVDMIQVGDVAARRRPARPARGGVRRHLRRRRTPTTSTPRIDQVRKGDADVAVEEQDGDTVVAHYTQTDQVKAAITQGALRAFVDGANVAATGAAADVHPRDRAGRGRLARHDPVRHARACSAGRSR